MDLDWNAPVSTDSLPLPLAAPRVWHLYDEYPFLLGGFLGASFFPPFFGLRGLGFSIDFVWDRFREIFRDRGCAPLW